MMAAILPGKGALENAQVKCTTSGISCVRRNKNVQLERWLPCYSVGVHDAMVWKC